jgi:hypothetical protein
MASFLTSVKNEQSDERLKILSHVMIESFGGMQGVVATWLDYYAHAMDQGGYAAWRCVQAMVRLMQYSEANRPDLADMTKLEAEEYLFRYAKTVIEREPELAVAAAESLGWTVIPPTSSSNPTISAE